MKYLVRTLIASAVLFFSTATTQALEMPDNDTCIVIPRAVFSAPLTTTVVGLHANQTTAANASIAWSFFDPSGAERASGDIPTMANTLNGFVLSSALSPALQNIDGFLLFCLDNNNDNMITDADGHHLTASAFFVDTANSDVAFVPIIPTDDSDLNQPDTNQWMNGMPIAFVGHGNDIDENDTVTIQYAINGIPNNGDDTRIYIFSTGPLGPSQNMTIFNSTGASTPLNNVLTPNQFLNVIDPETVVGIDAMIFPTGFINWVVPATFTGEAYAFSVIKSPAFGAMQTLVSLLSNN